MIKIICDRCGSKDIVNAIPENRKLVGTAYFRDKQAVIQIYNVDVCPGCKMYFEHKLKGFLEELSRDDPELFKTETKQ